MIFENINFTLPDIFLCASFSLFIFIKLIFNETISKNIFSKLSIIICLTDTILNFAYREINYTFSNRLFIYDKSIYFIKAILSFCFALCCVWFRVSRTRKEFSSLIYIIVFGVFCSLNFCISVNNFLILLLGIEGAALSICFLLMENRENAMKYLLISSIISGFFIYGISLCYSEFGSLCFFDINSSGNLIFVIGTTLILSVLLFEIHAAPFHSWVIDIYEKASIAVVAFLDIIFQFLMFFIFAKIIELFIYKQILFYKPFLYILSILSMLIGSVMAIKQKNIKKFIAYSSIGQVGFVLSVIAIADNASDFKYSMFYMFSYIISSACFFFSIMSLEKIRPIKEFSDLKGLINDAPAIGYGVILSMFSMIGSPPFLNFFAKLKILGFLISKNAWLALAVSVLYSILGFLYVAKAVRYLFMDNTEKFANKKSYSAAIPLAILILGIFAYPHIESLFSEFFTLFRFI